MCEIFLWGKLMKYSKYNYVYAENNNYLMMNFFTGNQVILSEEEYKAFLEIDSTVDDIDNEFYKLGFWIRNEVDELSIIKYDTAYHTVNNLPYFRILTTTGCNAKCGYCYESGIKKVAMNEQTIKKTCLFIESHAKKSQMFNIEL